MGRTIELTAADGHRLSAYRADPPGDPRAGLVIIQEVFGVNAHVRRVCDDFAGAGYLSVAPALFERVEPGVELGYSGDELARGRELRTRLGWDAPLRDVDAAIAAAREAGKVAAVGYCWGGSVAWLAATRLDVDCAACYYGGQIVQFADEHPRCPVLMHFGEKDPIIPSEDVERIRAAHPDIPVYVYPAGHGFNCEVREDYHRESAELARQRTLEFLERHLG